MKIYLEEGIDYKWVEREAVFMYDTVTVKSIELTNGSALERVQSPSSNTVVLIEKDSKLIPILILGGQYSSNGRVSNHWSWREIKEDMSLSEIKQGYGAFYKSHRPFEVDFVIRLTG